jgi:tRNA(fMet)-specific endonuclease VapC
MFLLDTHACIAILNGSSSRLVARLRQHEPDDIAVSAITRAELLYGARKSARVAENLGVLKRFLAACVSVPPTSAA